MACNVKLMRNIYISYIYNFLLNFRMTHVIWVIYLAFKGLSLTEIGILEAIFHVTSFVCEVPTGALADIYGRKWSVLLGRIASVASGYLMILCDSMLGFSLAFIFSALGYTLNSGAEISLVYDSLCQNGKEKDYTRFGGVIHAISELAQGAAVILGGYFADVSYTYAYKAMLLVDILSAFVAWNFREPIYIREKEQRQGLFTQVSLSLELLRRTKRAYYYMLFYSLITASGTTVYFYCQKHFEVIGYSKMNMVTIFVVESLLRAFCANIAYQVEGVLKQKGIIFLMILVNVVGLLGLAVTDGVWNVLCFLFISAMEGLTYPIFGQYINSLIPSSHRSTLLSVESTMFSICMIAVFPLVGAIGDFAGLRAAFAGLSLLLLLAALFVVYKFGKCVSEDLS